MTRIETVRGVSVAGLSANESSGYEEYHLSGFSPSDAQFSAGDKRHGFWKWRTRKAPERQLETESVCKDWQRRSHVSSLAMW
jgi:hypothetical protein